MNAIHFNSITKTQKNREILFHETNHSTNNIQNTHSKLLICTKSSILSMYRDINSKDSKLEEVSRISLDIGDEILETIVLENKNLIILTGKNSKKIIFYEVNFKSLVSSNIKQESKILHTFQHIKKITNVQYYQNDDHKDYLIYSDKFGEIFVLDIDQHLSLASNGVKEDIIEKTNEEENEQKSVFPVYMLYGHSDSISFLLLNKENIISSDCLGKIKICEFPNIYEIRTVLLYENFFYINTFMQNYLLVINNNSNINLWNLKTLKLDFDNNIFSDDISVEFTSNTNNFSFIEVIGDYLLVSLKNDKRDRLFVFRSKQENEISLVLIKEIEDEHLTKSHIVPSLNSNNLVIRLICENNLCKTITV